MASPPRILRSLLRTSTNHHHHQLHHHRQFTASSHRHNPPRHPTQPAPPKTTIAQRGAVSTEDTQTDFAALDMLRSFAPPATSIEMCRWDGFALNNGVDVEDGSGLLLVGGEGFLWRPWMEATSRGGGVAVVNAKGQFEVAEAALGVFGLAWPRPDLLILGTGGRLAPLAPATRKTLNAMGIRVEVQDTRNAAAQFNLLATERGVQQVAAALIPIGFGQG